MLIFIIFLSIALLLCSFLVLQRINKKGKIISTNDKFADLMKELNSLNENEVETTEDNPIDFGYKLSWLAIRTNDQLKVAQALKPNKIINSNWESGIKLAYRKASFVTPPINDWILVANYFPLPDHENNVEDVSKNLINLSNVFGEVQLFGTHRVVEFHCWAKAIDGYIQRAYAYIGEQGKNIWIVGEPTEIEKNLKLVNTFSDEENEETYWDQIDLVIPDEELVMQIAESWSINPTTLSERIDIKGLGLIIQ